MPAWAVQLLTVGMVCLTIIVVVIKLANAGAFN